MAMAGASVISTAKQIFDNPNSSKNLRKQREQQAALNEQAAKTNYEYGEKAADSAFQRQMTAYERTLQEESPAAMVQRYKDAGLSPALMYQGGGGQIGSMSHAPQAATGGAQAGTADTPVQKQMAAMNQTRIGMELAQMKANIELTEATTAKTETESEKIGGVDTELANTNIQLALENIESTRVQRAGQSLQNEYQSVMNYIAKKTKDMRVEAVQYEVEGLFQAAQKTYEEVLSAARANDIGDATKQTVIDTIKAQLIDVIAAGALKIAGSGEARANAAYLNEMRSYVSKRFNMDDIMNQWKIAIEAGTLTSEEQRAILNNIANIMGATISAGGTIIGGGLIGAGRGGKGGLTINNHMPRK